MSVMGYIPESVRNNVSSGCDFVQKAYTKACSVYGQGEEWAVGQCRKNLTGQSAVLAEKVVKAIPETFVLLSAFTRVGTYAMNAFLAAKTAYVLWPVVSTAVTKGFGKEDMDSARQRTISRLQASIEPFAPALATSSSVCALAGWIMGMVRCNPTLLGHSDIHAIMAWIGYKATNLQVTSQ